MRLVLALLSFLLASPLAAGAPYRVVDLRAWGDGASSNADYVATVGDVALFLTRETGSEERALWRTDGTAAGTFALLDPITVADDAFLRLGGVVYFAQSGKTVWKTDGTVAGTVRVPALDDTDRLLAQRGDAFFRLRVARRELWITDSAGSRPLALLRNGFEAWTEAGAWGDGIFVATERGVWKSDGTAAGTLQLTTSAAWSAVVAGERLYFFADPDNDGLDLWTTDGTEAGTMVLAANLARPPTTRAGAALAAIGDRVLFNGSGKVVVSDGTPSGTQTLLSGAATPTPQIAALAGIAFFTFDDGVHGAELWRSDGTTAGTWLVYDTVPGRAGGGITALTAAASRIYFFGSVSVPTAQAGSGLYVSDGTTTGTRLLLRTIRVNCCAEIAAAGDRAFFSAYDHRYGGEPWVSDGSESGTRMIANLAVEAAGSSSPYNLVAAASKLYFVAIDDEGRAIWSTDGTEAGTKIASRSAESDLVPAGAIGDTLFYGTDGDLRATDGVTDKWISRISSTGWRPTSAGPDAVIGNRLLFFRGSELMTTDGTAAGTASLMPRARRPLRFAGRTWLLSNALATTDGTRDGTRSIVYPVTWPQSADLVAFRGALFMIVGGELRRFSGGPRDQFFAATLFLRGSSGSYGLAATSSAIFVQTNQQLWRTDGTQRGTLLLADDFLDYSYSQPPPRLPVLRDRVVFAGYDRSVAREPWVSDGTLGGTKVLRDIAPGPASSDPDSFVVADGIAYFAATDPEHGRELWQTDGTPEGTQLVADIAPGPASSGPWPIVRFGDALYFGATTADAGRELWAYPLPDAPAITIADARALEREGRITIPVRLTRASQRTVTVDYETADDTATASTDYTAANGTLTFAPGETVKSIVIAIADVPSKGFWRAFLVNLKNASAPLERTSAAGIIEDDDRFADVGVSIDGASVVVTNHGPDIASSIELVSVGRYRDRVELTPVLLGNAERRVITEDADFEVSARALEPDPDPSNNSITFTAAHGRQVIVTPAVFRAGETGKLFIAEALLASGAKTVTSSDPAILSVTAPVSTLGSTYASSVLTAHDAGTATITIDGTSRKTLDVTVVGATEPRRMPVRLESQFYGGAVFGRMSELRVVVRGMRLDGSTPSGALEFIVDGERAATAPVTPAETRLWMSLLPGTHQTLLRYSGDARFLDAALPGQVVVSRAVPSLRATSDANVLAIRARGVPGFVPGGTITIAGQAHALVADGTEAVATIGPIAADARTVTLSYSGDAFYLPMTGTIPIDRPRTRGVRP